MKLLNELNVFIVITKYFSSVKSQNDNILNINYKYNEKRKREKKKRSTLNDYNKILIS